jgi:2-oxoisovalerate dehydrogenase E1 component
MEEYFFPQPEWILDAINERIIPLKGHKNKTDFSTDKSITLNKEGV